MFHLKPDIAFVIDLVYKLDQRTLFEKLVAHLVLDMSDEVKEVISVDLGVAEDIPQEVCERSFDLQQRLEGHLVDLLETIPINIRKVFHFQLPHQVFIGFGQVHLPQGAMGVNVELLEYHLAADHLIIHDPILSQDLKDHLLLLSHRAFDT